jgi:hypothetical protein
MQDVLAVIIGNGKAEGFISPDLDVTKLVDDVFSCLPSLVMPGALSNSKFDLESGSRISLLSSLRNN